MKGKRFIRTIRLQNILSYGPDTAALSLEPLNVLIGPNASGKSNLIEALSLLAAAPGNLEKPIRKGGGVRDWLWKGGGRLDSATVNATLEYPEGPMPLRYRLSFGETGARFDLRDEAIENENPFAGNDSPYLFYAYREGRPVLNVFSEEELKLEEQTNKLFGISFEDVKFKTKRRLRQEIVKPDRSILFQRRDPHAYPELTYLADQFERMRFYREWGLGRHTSPRLPQQADLPNDILLEDAANLGLVLSYLQNQPVVKLGILDRLKTFYPAVDDIVVTIVGGAVQIFFHEAGLTDPVPATRLSDGSLRYLCLLAVLCHPEPPPVVCIEEPELGLHPDVIPEVANLLVEASSRSQVIVTTHSDILVDALTGVPESVIVCEKSGAATQLRRLDRTELKPWLEKYRLGDLWTRGELGGTRW